jgi:hypothetical protein
LIFHLGVVWWVIVRFQKEAESVLPLEPAGWAVEALKLLLLLGLKKYV